MLDDPTYLTGQFIRTYTSRRCPIRPDGTRHRAGQSSAARSKQALRPAALLVIVFGLAVSAQQRVTTPAASEWQTYNHDLAGTRFSPLTEINTGNVSTIAKRVDVPVPRRPAAAVAVAGAASEAVPIVVGGVMYLPVGNTIVALEADTGKLVWQREVTGAGPGAVSRRGVGVLAGRSPDAGADHRDGRQAADGARCRRPASRRKASARTARSIRWSAYGGAPTIYKNVVMIGANVNEVPQGPPGDTRAFDARHRQEALGISHRSARAANSATTRGAMAGKSRSGTNIWGFSMTVDEARGIVYMPIAGPAANYYGGDRPGNNLFGNSIVAVDIATGKYKWHFQTVHHDIWDIDMSAAPGPGRYQAERPDDPGAGDVGKGGLHVHPRSHHRETGVRRRGAAGPEGQRAG